MEIGTLPASRLKILLFGLLVLAGVFSGTHTASAQMHEACPLASGVTPPADPRVTAQQVESGSASLMDFALVARDHFKRVSAQSLQQAYHFGCLIRQEGGPWRSGSTYLVQLTLDGRVFVHSQDMTLSGRRLNRAILAEILTSLGVARADLGKPAAILNTLLDEPHAAFDATAPIPSQRPGIPGAKGYASVYKTARRPDPIILLAGFNLRLAHMAPEQIDYGAPAVAARDVVDRASLKAFVEEAATYFGEARRAEGRVGISKAKIAMRDPNGPWRHGSVYLYVLDLTTNIILIHGAFPDRFELRPLVATVRDAVTGELVLPQVLAAAASSPEGGFVEYYFDDPSDASDSADIPKVGYAREYQFQATGGAGPQSRVVIGSGFYLSDPGVVTARQNKAIKDVLPQVMRAMTASTVDAVSSRIQQASSGTTPAKAFSLGGASTLYDALLANGQALGNDTFDLGRLFASSSFTLPLDGTGSSGGLFGDMSIWGSGDYRDFDGGDRQLDYDGDVVSVHLGIDTRLRTDLLAGVSVAWSQGMVDYRDESNVKGKSKTTLTSINPYMGWQASERMNLWAAAGYGWGEVEVNDQSAEKEDSDMDQQMVAAGINGLLYEADAMTLRLKAEAAFTWADIDGSGTLERMNLNASRQRLLIEGAHVQKLASGATLTPSLELGVRHDGGDGDTGSSIEAGGSLRYNDPESGLTVEGRARTLLDHSDDYDEWGMSGLVQLDPGAAGVGLALMVQPAWGHTASGVQRLWESGGVTLANQGAGRVNARLAYGIGSAWDGQGVLTPYTDMLLSGDGSRRLSLGSRFDIGTSLRISLEGVHDQPAHGKSHHSVMLHGDLNW